MPLRLKFLLLVSLSAHSTFAQFTALEQQHATVEYASINNPNYWKNRKPFPGYWQQDVNYQIKANIDEVRDAITGTERLVYTNNSPDTLRWVFFHLYQNAFQPGSYCDALHKANDYPLRYGPYESMKMGTLVNKITVNGLKPKTELDNTLLKVWLPEMLLPGQSVEFDIEFLTAFDAYGNVRRRMKMFNAYGNKHFDGVHWYPRLAVYDRKFGWCTDQHLGKEFYGNFGSYEVELTFSSDYVVEATGVLLNKSEVLPDTLMKKLDMRNFASKKWDEAPSVITPYQRNKRKTWKYRAINVHDFAWTADPTYRIGEAEWNGIKIVALVQEPHASRWQNAADYTAKIIETYSRDFGMYVYNKMVVADARDGMEYPMLTLDGDADPGYRDLLAHEVGHNWFFGMVGSNETYRASLDEGFTQFLTSWALENIDGPQTLRMPHPNAYTEKFTTEESVRYTTVYRGYLRDAIREDETTLNTHSDDFGGALRHGGGYGNVYYKTATMLYNLQYVLGDTLFLRAMKHYFNQWKMAHPYPEDFRNSIIQFTKADLNWFFDQWFETYKTIDYKVYKPKDLGDGKYRLRIKRKGAMQMPLDLRVTDADGKFYNYYIPNTWFEKSTSAQILPRWIGWGKLNPVYETEITIPAGIENVEIDTTGRLADVIRYNNTIKSKQTVKFDSRVQNAPDWKHYEMFARPDLWYNFYDGVKIGMHMNGHYMQQRHKFELSFWLNNGLGKVQQSDVNDMNGYNLFSFSMRYQTPTHQWVKHSRAVTEARYLDGLRLLKLGWELDMRSEQTTFYVFGKYMERRDTSDINYLIYKNEWNPAAVNMTLNTGLRHSYTYKRGSGNIDLGLRTTAPGSDYDFSQLSLEVINDNYLRRWNIRTRFFAQYGSGSNWAPESQLYLAGANPEQLMENKFTRSAAFVPQSFSGYGANTNHFHAGGGLNVRGYSGYAAPHTLDNGSVIPLYKGTSGVSGNIEIDLDHLAPLKPRITRKWLKMDVYLFGDAGYLAHNVTEEPFKLDHIRASAGAGTALTIKSWGPLTMERPLVLRFDVPFFLNRTPDVSPDYVQFRWIVGVNRSF